MVGLLEGISAQVEDLRNAQHDKRFLPDGEAFCPLLGEDELPLVVAQPHQQAAVAIPKNGDRITGRIVKMEKRRLEIDPAFSDIIKIKWDDVQNITSERPMSVNLYGELDLPENAEDQDSDRIILYTLGEDGAIRLEDLRAINFAENDHRATSASAAINRPATRRRKP